MITSYTINIPIFSIHKRFAVQFRSLPQRFTAQWLCLCSYFNMLEPKVSLRPFTSGALTVRVTFLSPSRALHEFFTAALALGPQIDSGLLLLPAHYLTLDLPLSTLLTFTVAMLHAGLIHLSQNPICFSSRPLLSLSKMFHSDRHTDLCIVLLCLN